MNVYISIIQLIKIDKMKLLEVRIDVKYLR